MKNQRLQAEHKINQKIAELKNQAIVQADKVNIQSRNVGNDGKIARCLYNVQEETAEGSNVQKENENVHRNLQTSSRNVTNVQCYNYNEKGHYARNCPKPKVQDSKYFMEQMLLAKRMKQESFSTMNKMIFFLLMLFKWKSLKN
ncbi:gag-pol polyprotein [Tanacetum coccineum]|uniref:Gag-pol polyprotein n=1 Tax=Tanacetum coccineum TaxID=301880 RepID=A0ABQ4ZXS2_9ASTR